MIEKFVFLLILVPKIFRGQSVEPIDSLVATLIYHNKTGLEEQINLLRSYKERNFLSLLPSIGYDLITNRFLVNFSLNSWIAAEQRKKDLKYQVRQVRIRYREQLGRDTLTCRAYYNDLKVLLSNYTGQLSIADSSSQLLLMKQEEHRRFQVPVEDVLKVQLDLERLRLSADQLKNEISSKALQISLLIKRNLQYTVPSPQKDLTR